MGMDNGGRLMVGVRGKQSRHEEWENVGQLTLNNNKFKNETKYILEVCPPRDEKKFLLIY